MLRTCLWCCRRLPCTVKLQFYFVPFSGKRLLRPDPEDTCSRSILCYRFSVDIGKNKDLPWLVRSISSETEVQNVQCRCRVCRPVSEEQGVPDSFSASLFSLCLIASFTLFTDRSLFFQGNCFLQCHRVSCLQAKGTSMCSSSRCFALLWPCVPTVQHRICWKHGRGE